MRDQKTLATEDLVLVAERRFRACIKNEVIPSVMGGLPHDIEVEVKNCLASGISQETIDSILEASWSKAKLG